jgi:hypothetical protein
MIGGPALFSLTGLLYYIISDNRLMSSNSEAVFHFPADKSRLAGGIQEVSWLTANLPEFLL